MVKNGNNILAMMVSLLMMTGCFKEDMPYSLQKVSPNSTYTQLDCNVNDNKMVYFDLSTGNTQSFSNDLWHIAFDNRPQGASARVNLTVSDQYLYQSETKNFSIPASEIMQEKNRRMDSVNNWYSNNVIRAEHGQVSNVFVYHKAPNIQGKNEQKYKFQILDITSKHYVIKFVDLMNPNSMEKIIGIDKNPGHHFTHLSFANGGLIQNLEPKKEDWDLVFTQYRDMVKYEVDLEFYPYQVLGALLNPGKSSNYEMENSKPFEQINSADCKLAEWNKIINTIGYDWKSYSINQSIYQTDTAKTWLLKDQDDLFFKLRFINFYNNQGKSGHPTIEYAQF